MSKKVIPINKDLIKGLEESFNIERLHDFVSIRPDLDIYHILRLPNDPDNEMAVWKKLVEIVPQKKTLLICVDGNHDEIDFTELISYKKLFPEFVTNRTLELLYEGKVPGVAAFQINEKYPGVVHGVENPYLYNENAKIAIQLIDRKDELSFLISETKALINIIKDEIAHLNNQTMINILLKRLRTIEFLFNMQLTFEEFRDFDENRIEFTSGFFTESLIKVGKGGLVEKLDLSILLNIDNEVEYAEKFYFFASMRSRELLQNTIKLLDKFEQKKCILITSNWHGDPIKQLCQEFQIDYSSDFIEPSYYQDATVSILGNRKIINHKHWEKQMKNIKNNII